ncbi:MAG: flippase [Nitrospirae bacterium]|nr:MAG: flippase [Nitrospirota bacterium]
MLSSLKSLIVNTTVIYIIELFSRAFQFALIIYSARTLGVAAFGNLSYSLTIYFLFSVLSDFGFNMFLTREVSQNPNAVGRILGLALRFRTCVGIVIYIMFVAYLNLLEHSQDIRIFFVLTGLSVIFSSYALNYILALRGLGRIKTDGLIRIAGSFIGTVVSLAGLKAGLGMQAIAVGISIGNVSMIVTSVLLDKQLGIAKISGDLLTLSDYAEMLKRSVPFVLIVVISNVFQRVDTVLLQHLKGSVEVGLYHAAFKITDAILIFQTAFAIVLFPVLSSRIAAGELEVADEITDFSIKYTAIIGVFLSVLTFMLADKIIELMYFSTDYSASGAGLKTLALVIFLLYISTPIGYLLLSSRFAYMAVWLNSIMLVANAGLNFALIPHYGFMGAAAVRGVTELLGLSLTVLFVKRYIMQVRYFTHLWRPVIAGAAMAVVIYLARSFLFLPLYFAVYAAILAATGAVSKKEIVFVRDVFLERINKL